MYSQRHLVSTAYKQSKETEKKTVLNIHFAIRRYARVRTRSFFLFAIDSGP